MYRFQALGEMDDERRPDFTESDWLHIKILAQERDNTKAMAKSTYVNAFNAILKKLGIMVFKKLHFGRHNGSAELEAEEVSPELIRILGNWAQQVQEKFYSTGMVFEPMRVLAGNGKDEALWYPRVAVGDPPEDLCRMIFPWIEQELERVYAYANSVASIPEGRPIATAVSTLRFWKELRVIILQDAAEMLIREPDRARHPFFEDQEDVFGSTLFEVSSTEAFCTSTLTVPFYRSTRRP